MSSRFYFGSPASSDNEEGSDFDDASLPFPKPLARSAFLAPNFDPATFLASLTSRFQTLEDLQSELRQLSTGIQTELVDLVNDNYEEFLGLGTSLSGGEEKIEEVRVGMMGVERELTALRAKVEEERRKVAQSMEMKRAIVREGWVGRDLLEMDRRIGELETGLGISEAKTEEPQKADVQGSGEWGDVWKEDASAFLESSDEEDEQGLVEGKAPRRLLKRVEQWLCIKHLLGKYDSRHPFLLAEQPRLKKIKETLLIDIDASIRARGDVLGKQRLLEIRKEIDD